MNRGKTFDDVTVSDAAGADADPAASSPLRPLHLNNSANR